MQMMDEHGDGLHRHGMQLLIYRLLLSGVFGLKKDIEGIWFEGFIPTVLSEIRISISDMSICVLMCPQKVKGNCKNDTGWSRGQENFLEFARTS